MGRTNERVRKTEDGSTRNQKSIRSTRCVLQGRALGRPRTIQSPERMVELLEEYLEHCEEHDESVTMSGLQLFMGIHANGFGRYSNLPEFEEAINICRKVVISLYEGRLDRDRCAGAIFAMKNLAGWRDRREVSTASWLRSLNLDLDRLPNHMIERLANGDFTVLFEALGFDGPDDPTAAEVLQLPPGRENG